jgi:CheY-like chemotaxis protein
MPVMDGFEATLQIRKLYEEKKLKKLPFICALTAYTTNAF